MRITINFLQTFNEGLRVFILMLLTKFFGGEKISALKHTIDVIMLALFILSGCSENGTSSWQPDPTFTFDNRQVYGIEGSFGIEKANGENDEPEFPAGLGGRLYHLYFLEENFNGQRFNMTAMHEDSEEIIELYEWDIENKQSGAKLGFEQEGTLKNTRFSG